MRPARWIGTFEANPQSISLSMLAYCSTYAVLKSTYPVTLYSESTSMFDGDMSPWSIANGAFLRSG